MRFLLKFDAYGGFRVTLQVVNIELSDVVVNFVAAYDHWRIDPWSEKVFIDA